MPNIGNPKVIGYLDNGKQPNCDDSSVGTDMAAWNRFAVKLKESINAGQTFFNKGI